MGVAVSDVAWDCVQITHLQPRSVRYGKEIEFFSLSLLWRVLPGVAHCVQSIGASMISCTKNRFGFSLLLLCPGALLISQQLHPQFLLIRWFELYLCSQT